MKWSGMAVISLSRAVRIDSVERWLRGLENSQHPLSNIRPAGFWRQRLQSRDQVSQKAGGVVIPFVQRQPGHRSLAAGKPFADQRSFAKASRSGDEGQFTVHTLVQPLDQAGAQDDFSSRWGDIKFGG